MAKGLVGPEEERKFGVYDHDTETFDRIRSDDSDHPTVDAQVMDIADDITYAIHDLHDFWRAGLIPVDRLRDSDEAFEDFVTQWRADPSSPVDPDEISANAEQLRDRLRFYFPETYGGTFRAEALQNRTLSILIGEMVRAVTLAGEPERPLVQVDAANRLDLRFLQRLTWHYVITNPRLSTQQAGQERMIEALFDFFHGAANAADRSRLPARLGHLVEDARGGTPARIASDAVAGLSDAEASALYRRICGIASGSVLDSLQL